MAYSNKELIALKDFYSNQLLNDTVPFWFPRSFDNEHGGFLLMRDEDGSLIDDDKAVWIQGRATWMLATLYNTVEKKQEWLDGAKLGYDFLNKHCFDADGQMFFHVTREGRPIRKRRYFFSETFYVIAAAAYAKASGDAAAADKARRVFGRCIEYATKQGLLQPKFTNTRPSKGIGVPMIMMNTAQQLRETIGDPRCDEWISKWIAEIERDFVKDDIKCVMEQVAPDGGIIDHMWERGWDKDYGGILYFRDLYNKPVQEYWQDMKFWWPHNEVIIATLLAYLMTGNEKYATMHKQIHDYAYQHFHDKKNGEWFGYLHRDGSIAQTAKGNLYKGPFHLPRQEWYCLQLLKEHIN